MEGAVFENENVEEEPESDENLAEDDYHSASEEDTNGSEDDVEEFRDNGNRFLDIENRNQPLYHGARISVEGSMLLILALLLHHNLTMECIKEIIIVLELHCLTENLVKNSLYKFRKFFNIRDNTLIKHYYCSICTRHLESLHHDCPVCGVQKKSYFIQLRVTEQLRELYSRNGFYDKLQLRFQRPRQTPNSISDIYDSNLYREWMGNNFLSDARNISFSWFTDGVPVFKSSKISMWPVYLTINELPFEVRKKRENTLLLGFWYDDKKPNMNTFFYKFREELQEIFDGVQVLLHDNTAITVRGVLLMGVCDLPAKYECLNFIQYNGDHGCAACLLKGETVTLESGGKVHVYPYTDELTLRTTQESIAHANRATPNNPVFGVKGPTMFSRLMPDFIRGMGIDRMHGGDGGVLKRMMSLFFDVEFRNAPFSLYNVIDVINNRLATIKPPHFIHRMPRTVLDLCHWKASELKHFLFYYSIPIFEGIMRIDFYEHYLRFVLALAILSSEEITEQMLYTANDLLRRFVREFQDIYGIRYCTINVHQLLHYVDCVKNLGPLWVYTCYEYENLNGQFLKLIHGTRRIDTQIARSQNQFLKIIGFIENVQDERIREFCLQRKKQVKILEQVHPHCYSVGVYKILEDIPDVVRNALTDRGIGFDDFTVWNYYRLLKNNKLYISDMYGREKKTSSSTVLFFDEGFKQFGFIYTFVKLSRCNCLVQPCHCESEHYAIIKKIECNSVFIGVGNETVYSSADFLYKCHELDNFKAAPIQTLSTTCIYMKFNNQAYVAVPINNKELE